jgi:hypothetical protein
VNFLGLGGYKDWQLMARIRSEDYTFVTNNRTDFTALYAREELHAGLVIIIPNVTPSRQRQLFRAALAHIDKEGSDKRRCWKWISRALRSPVVNTSIQAHKAELCAACGEPYEDEWARGGGRAG